MPASLFARIFPPPKYLMPSFVGLDISDQSVKFIESGVKHGQLIARRYASGDIPAGVIEAGKIIDRDRLGQVLTAFRREFKLANIIVSLPEEQAFVVRIELPNMKKSELRGSIELQIEEYIPLRVPEIIFDYEILSRPKTENDLYHLSVSVLPRQMVANYFDVLTEAGFWPLAFEIEGQALARALVPAGDLGTYLIVDIGKMRTGFAIVTEGVVTFTSTVSHIGGEDVTKSVSKNLDLPRAEAEKLKIEKGLLRSAENKNLFYALVPVVSALADEIRRVNNYWQTHRDIHQKAEFDKIILTGGQCTLPGLTDYLSVNLDIQTVIGNPWVNWLSFNKVIPDIDFNNVHRYATALGLALRGRQ